MDKRSIIERTIKAISQLPADKAEEVYVFADFLIRRHEEQKLSEGIEYSISNSHSFSFLNEEEELYSQDDLKEVYNAQR